MNVAKALTELIRFLLVNQPLSLTLTMAAPISHLDVLIRALILVCVRLIRALQAHFTFGQRSLQLHLLLALHHHVVHNSNADDKD